MTSSVRFSLGFSIPDLQSSTLIRDSLRSRFGGPFFFRRSLRANFGGDSREKSGRITRAEPDHNASATVHRPNTGRSADTRATAVC